MKDAAKFLSLIALLLLRRRSSALFVALGTAYSGYRRAGASLSPNLTAALLIAEDRRFYRHGGVDPAATLRAIWYFVFKRRLVGGSTIEQQLIRTLLGERERTVRRKVREILLSTLVSRVVPKTDVPGLYLSVAYFGWRMNGLRDACRRLGYRPDRLSAGQAASVVARLKYPEPEYQNQVRRKQIKIRTEYILAALERVRRERLKLPIEAPENAAIFDF